MVVPHFTATGLLNMIESRFLWNVHQKMRFFFFLKLHLIKGQWSAAGQTSNCLTSNPDGLWRVLLALLPSEAFELDSYVMACVCGDLMPAKLKWEALNMSLQTPPSVKARACHSSSITFGSAVTCRGLETFSRTCGADLCGLIPAFFVLVWAELMWL